MNLKRHRSVSGARLFSVFLLYSAATFAPTVLAQNSGPNPVFSFESRSRSANLEAKQIVEGHFPSASSAAVENNADDGTGGKQPVNMRFGADEPIARACLETLRRQNRTGAYASADSDDEEGDEIKIRPAAVRETFYFARETDMGRAHGFPEKPFDVEAEIPCADCRNGKFESGVESFETRAGFRSQYFRFSDDPKGPGDTSFRWGPAVKQSMMFLGVQLGFALATQSKTRQAVSEGNFFVDYYRSVKSLRGWDDQGRFFTNYIAHPMQGALTGFIHVQNDPKGIDQQFGLTKGYWRSRSYAFLWSTFWSTQFELGPISQASIGNIGLAGKQAWGDIVVTPIAGTAWLIAEDAIDRYVTRHIEGKNLYIRALLRLILNPVRSSANLLRFKEPWYRDRPLRN